MDFSQQLHARRNTLSSRGNVIIGPPVSYPIERPSHSRSPSDMDRLFKENVSQRQQIDSIYAELCVYKAAIGPLQTEKGKIEAQYQALLLELDSLQVDMDHCGRGSQTSENRVICLIDGDGTIFAPSFIERGKSGGHDAAKCLSHAIKRELSEFDNINLWVYVFYHRRGLVDALYRAGLRTARDNFEEFAMGFTQASERFLMIDVGPGKEAADSKMKVYFEDHIGLPQVKKILFGGCHDNGYVNSLRSFLTEGYQDKLLLLSGYTEAAQGIDTLGLPSLRIPGLFLTEKLSDSGSIPSLHTRDRSGSGHSSLFQFGSPPNERPKMENVWSNSPSYRAILQASPVRNITPLPSDSASTSSSPDNDCWGSLYSLSSDKQSIHPTPGKPLSKHDPPPCTLFYVADNCKHGSVCKYSHSYILSEEHYEEMRVNAKKSPCPATNKNKVCTFGDDCCYGHVCPHLPRCPFFRANNCKFKGDGMHALK